MSWKIQTFLGVCRPGVAKVLDAICDATASVNNNIHDKAMSVNKEVRGKE